MKTQYLAIAVVAIATIFLATAPLSAGDDKKKIEQEMINEAKKAAEKGAVPHYEVKKSHDEHIPATEKAAADATRKDKPAK